MTNDLTSKALPDFVTVLTQAAAAYRGYKVERPSPSTMVNALLQAEKRAKQQRTLYPFESLLGQWQLCFATGTRKVKERGGIILGKGIYVPKFVSILICFHATPQPSDGITNIGEIGNSVHLGPLLLQLMGPSRYLGNKNILAFDFTQIQISLFSHTTYTGEIRGGKAKALNFYNQPIAKLAFFGFFLVTEDFIAARGRGGGLALWVKTVIS